MLICYARYGLTQAERDSGIADTDKNFAAAAPWAPRRLQRLRRLRLLLRQQRRARARRAAAAAAARARPPRLRPRPFEADPSSTSTQWNPLRSGPRTPSRPMSCFQNGNTTAIPHAHARTHTGRARMRERKEGPSVFSADQFVTAGPSHSQWANGRAFTVWPESARECARPCRGGGGGPDRSSSRTRETSFAKVATANELSSAPAAGMGD